LLRCREGSTCDSFRSSFALSAYKARLWTIGSSHLNSQLDPAAWVIPVDLNAIKNCAGCNEGHLFALFCEAEEVLIAIFIRFDLTQGPVYGKLVGLSHLTCHLSPAAWVLVGEMNAMENCAR
jgi:hypothetical protein